MVTPVRHRCLTSLVALVLLLVFMQDLFINTQIIYHYKTPLRNTAFYASLADLGMTKDFPLSASNLTAGALTLLACYCLSL